jgi:hypothetical protein
VDSAFEVVFEQWPAPGFPGWSWFHFQGIWPSLFATLAIILLLSGFDDFVSSQFVCGIICGIEDRR